MFLENDKKNNLSLKWSNVKDNKNTEDVLVGKPTEINYSSGDENTPRHSEYIKMKYLQQTLNSMNAFLLSLLMSYVGSWFKLLRISWYRSIKPFQTNLKLVIKKYLCSLHESFPRVDSSSNDVMLIETSKYISSYNINSISF